MMRTCMGHSGLEALLWDRFQALETERVYIEVQGRWPSMTCPGKWIGTPMNGGGDPGECGRKRIMRVDAPA